MSGASRHSDTTEHSIDSNNQRLLLVSIKEYALALMSHVKAFYT